MLRTRRLIIGVAAIAVAALLSYGLSGTTMTPPTAVAETGATCGAAQTGCGGCPGAPPATPAPCKCADCDGKCEECKCECEDGKCEGKCKDCDGKCEECKCTCKDSECARCRAKAAEGKCHKGDAAGAAQGAVNPHAGCGHAKEAGHAGCHKGRVKPGDKTADKPRKKPGDEAAKQGAPSQVRPLAEAFNLKPAERSR